MSGGFSNAVRMDEKFINPQHIVGPVILNAMLHTTLIARMHRNPTPYYPNPGGVDFAVHSKIGRGNVLFTILGNNGCLSALSHDSGYGHNGDQNRVKTVAVLNGLGMKGEGNNVRLWESAQIIGFSDGTPPTAAGLHSAVAGGVLTTTNEGPDVINAGDWVMVWFPSESEIPSGGMGQQADINGVVRPWLVTYDPIKHSLTPKPIYQCLTADKSEPFVPGYKRTCQRLNQSVNDMSLVTMGACYDEIVRVANSTNNKLEFVQGMAAILDKDVKVRERVRDHLFVPYSDKRNLLEPTKSADSPLNNRQMKAMGEYLLSTSVLQHTIQDKVVGKAVTTGRKRGNFALQICSYGKK
jgi:hypothetical protein